MLHRTHNYARPTNHTAYTFESHRTSQRVTYQTARVELLDLESRDFLERHTVGRQFWFYPSEHLADLLRRDT